MATLQYTRTFSFQINGKIRMSAVQLGALQDFFSDGNTIQAHTSITAAKEENVHVIGIPAESLGDICGWFSFFLEKLNKVRTICENTEKEFLKV